MPLSDEGSMESWRPFRFSGTWLYDLYRNWGSMGEITVSQAREKFAEVIESTQRSGEPIVLTRHGQPVAVVLEHAAFE
ncbi:MAG: type II toxin-antitoxin system Phd/YefM family antitoxin, partial [Cyanobium sp.]